MNFIFKRIKDQLKQFYDSIIYFSVKKALPSIKTTYFSVTKNLPSIKTTINYFFVATSIGVLISLFMPTTFWLIFANIYVILLNGFHSHILKSNKFIQITIVLWLLSLMLYALTLFIAVDETYIDMIEFAIRRFVFLLIFIITLTIVQDLPAMQTFQADYAIFDEGPSNKSAFLTFIRKYHIFIIFLSFAAYILATSVFVTNPSIATFFGILAFVFAALYLVQSILYLIAFWKKPLDKSSSISSKNSPKKKRLSRSKKSH